jgi:hypothetical protein
MEMFLGICISYLGCCLPSLHPPVVAAKAGRNNMRKYKTYPSPSLLETILNYMTTVQAKLT